MTEPFTLIPVQNTQVTAAVHGLTFRNFESPLSTSQSSEPHAVYWDMLRANLLQLLVDGTVRPHEPAYDPEPDAYVTWDYCRGYADASLNEAASESDGYR